MRIRSSAVTPTTASALVAGILVAPSSYAATRPGYDNVTGIGGATVPAFATFLGRNRA
ncbi:MAG: hypothetical protein ACR2LX_09895 [Jatrophihabitans sp.]